MKIHVCHSQENWHFWKTALLWCWKLHGFTLMLRYHCVSQVHLLSFSHVSILDPEKKTVSYSSPQVWPSQLVFIPSSAGNSAAWYKWAKWKWDNEMYSDDWEGPEWPGCLGPNPSSITHQFYSPWASDLSSPCLSFLICKMGVIMVASPNCYKD